MASPRGHGVIQRFPSATTRLRVALACALITGVYAAARAIHEPAWPTDFDQLWHAARALLQGNDPYAVVGPGRPFQWDWPLYYPLPAVLLSVPFAALPVAAARVAFSTVAGGVLGFALGARIRVLWPLFLSASYLIATSRTQWAPLLLAAASVPLVGVVVTAKPNVGLAALAALRGRGLLVALGGVATVLVVTLLIRPGWIDAWRASISDAPHIVPPILMPGGFLLALAVLRWRRSDARLLLALACVPHTPSLYDMLLLFYVCRTRLETITLSVLTHALFWGIVLFASFPSFDAYALGLGQIALFVIYLPVLVAVLIRPNVDVDRDAPTLSDVRAGGWRAFVPDTRVELVLLGVLLFGSTLLVWLPLVTYR